PLLGISKAGLEAPSLFRDADLLVVRHPLFLQLPDLIREEGMSFIDDQIGVHFFPLLNRHGGRMLFLIALVLYSRGYLYQSFKAFFFFVLPDNQDCVDGTRNPPQQPKKKIE